MYKLVTVIAWLYAFSLHGQSVYDLNEALDAAFERNPAMAAARVQTARNEALKGTAWDLPKTNISLMYGQFNSIHKNDNNITITQGIPFPGVFRSQHNLVKSKVQHSKIEEAVIRNQLAFDVRRQFNTLLYLKQRKELLLLQDSVFRELQRVASVQQRTGEGTILNATSAEAQALEARNQLRRNENDIVTALSHLALLCQDERLSDVDGDFGTLFDLVVLPDVVQNPTLRFGKQAIEVARKEKKLESSRVMPEFEVGYFNQSLIGPQNINGTETYFNSDERFQGFIVGISLPIVFTPAKARIKAADYSVQLAEARYKSDELTLSRQLAAAVQEIEKNKASIEYYRASALAHASMLLDQSSKAFRAGELEYTAHLQNVRQVILIREGYLSAVHEMNNNTITLLFLTGN
jgi:heavy metal efflux system protein